MKNEEYSIKIYDLVGTFAENKDKATDIRLKQIFPVLNEGKLVILDFEKVNSTTQSFIHALISDVIRTKGIKVLDKMAFKNCNEVVKTIIEIVVDYMQEPPKIINRDKNEKTDLPL